MSAGDFATFGHYVCNLVSFCPIICLQSGRHWRFLFFHFCLPSARLFESVYIIQRVDFTRQGLLCWWRGEEVKIRKHESRDPKWNGKHLMPVTWRYVLEFVICIAIQKHIDITSLKCMVIRKTKILFIDIITLLFTLFGYKILWRFEILYSIGTVIV